MNINYTKKKSGVPADKIVIKKIIDEKIISKPYAMRIADYILDTEGHKWWRMQATMAATEMLYKDEGVEFWVDGVRYEGFLVDHPDLKAMFRQGKAALSFNVDVLFLKDE